MPKPGKETYPSYYENYISLVAEEDVLTALENQQPMIDQFFSAISEEKSTYAYAPGKWTLKEMLQHIIDTERIFAFRALAFARGEQQPVPGFEENEYAANSNANARSWESLCKELKAVRKATRMLFENFSSPMMNQTGVANQKPVTVNAIGFVIVGHINHHKSIIEQRYN
jgi:dihydroorotate dehydrogenase